MKVDYKVESDVKPNKFEIENILNNKCDIVLFDNITETERAEYETDSEKEIIKTVYIYDVYRLRNIYRANLREELSTKEGFEAWLNFAKEQHDKEFYDISLKERIEALEGAILEIGEVVSDG